MSFLIWTENRTPRVLSFLSTPLSGLPIRKLKYECLWERKAFCKARVPIFICHLSGRYLQVLSLDEECHFSLGIGYMWMIKCLYDLFFTIAMCMQLLDGFDG